MAQHDRKQKILVTTSTLPWCEGDSEPRFVLDLAKQLRCRFDITILAPAHPGARLKDRLEGVDVVRYRYAPLRSQEVLTYPGAILPKLRSNPRYWLLVPMLLYGLRNATRRLLRTEDFNCVHCHWIFPQGLTQALNFSGAGNPPFVVTSHGGDAFALNNPTALRRLKRMVLRRASEVTVVSDAIRQKLVADHGLECAKHRIRVIPMGVDLDRFNPRFREDFWVERHGLVRPVVLFVGRLDEKKGVTYLLRALNEPPLSDTNVSVAVVGDGPMRPALEREAQQLNLSNRVRFLGAMDHTKLRVAYASADVFCAPSIVAKSGDREGLPTVLIEAAASGLPAVATRVSGIPEIVVNGETGFLVSEKCAEGVAQALKTLISNEELRAKMRNQALARASDFGWGKIGDRYADVLQNAIEANSRKRS